MSKRLFAHGGIYGIARVVSQGAQFLLIPLYNHYLGTEGFGIVSLMGAIGTCLGLVFIQGLHGSWFRLRFDEPDADGLRRFESTIVWYLAGSVVVGVTLLLLLGPWFAHYIMGTIPFYPYGMLTVIYAGATVFVTLVERKYQAEQQPRQFAIFTIARTLMILGTIVLFVAVLGQGVVGKLTADVVSAMVLMVVAIYCIRPGGIGFFSRPRLNSALAYGLPLLPHHLAGFANDMIDRAFVNGMISTEANGIYSMGYRVGAVGLLVAMSMNQAYAPLFVKSMKEAETARERGEDTRAMFDVVAQAALLLVTLIACIAMMASAIAREALMVVASKFDDSWLVVPVVAAASVVWSCYFPFSQSMAYDTRRARYLGVVTIAAALVNIGANLVLIQRWGIVGAALATLLSCMVMSLLALFMGQTGLHIPYRWRRWAIMLSSCFVGLAAIWALDLFVSDTLTRLLAKLVVGGLMSLLCVGATGARVADFKRLLVKS